MEHVIKASIEWQNKLNAGQRAWEKHTRETLADSYIKHLLGLKNPPQELIELKRVQLKIYRELQI